MIENFRSPLVAGAALAALGAGLAGGTPALAAVSTTNSDYGFVAKIEIGEPGGDNAGACSAALVHPQWVITSAACAASSGAPALSGIPRFATSVIVGRPDLSTSAGHALTAVKVVTHPDRDVAMVKLASPVTDVTPVSVGPGSPVAGEVLQIAGYGRTHTEWLPSRQHSGDLTVNSSTTTSTQLVTQPDSTVCKGDSGAPMLRNTGSQVTLVAVASKSGQHGCYGENEQAPTDVTGARVDDIGDWISATLSGFSPSFDPGNDFNNDGNIDIAAHNGRNNMELFLGDGKGQLRFGGLMWPEGGQWAGFHSITAGDFNNDGNIDIAAHNGRNNMELFLGDGKGQLRFGGLMWPEGGQWAGMHSITAGDFNNDGKIDIAAHNSRDNMELFLGDGAGNLRSGGLMWPGPAGQWAGFHSITAGDFNNDGNIDIAAHNGRNNMELFLGDGKGQLRFGGLMWPEGGQWAGMHSITAGDFNNDGKIDIAAHNSRDNMELFLGDGAGNLRSGGLMWPGPAGQWAGMHSITS